MKLFHNIYNWLIYKRLQLQLEILAAYRRIGTFPKKSSKEIYCKFFFHFVWDSNVDFFQWHYTKRNWTENTNASILSFFKLIRDSKISTFVSVIFFIGNVPLPCSWNLLTSFSLFLKCFFCFPWGGGEGGGMGWKGRAQ